MRGSHGVGVAVNVWGIKVSVSVGSGKSGSVGETMISVFVESGTGAVPNAGKLQEATNRANIR
jgi:hypothetical protein